MSRQISYIAIHCTATSQEAKVASIQNYWRTSLGWRSPGYHVIIEASGNVVRLAEDSAICNGVQGFNSVSLHVSYIGGIDRQGKPKDTRTRAQIAAMEQVVKEWKAKYPNAIVQGHRDFPKVSKACPSFEVKPWAKSIGC